MDGGEYLRTSQPPVSDRFVAKVDAAHMQQVLDISKQKQQPSIQHHRKADDFRTGLEEAIWRTFGHCWTLVQRTTRLKPDFSDIVPNGAAFCRLPALKEYPAFLT